jgi:hypothetical protein
MLTKTFSLALLLPIFTTLTSCSPIFWQNPVSPIKESVRDERLPGAWAFCDSRTSEKEVKLWIGKPVDGWMSFCTLLPNPFEHKLLFPFFGKMYVSRLEGRTFLNVTSLTDGENFNVFSAYFILEYKIAKRKLWLYAIDRTSLTYAIEGKELSAEGTGEEGFLIHSSSKEIREFIKRYPKDQLFPRHVAGHDRWYLKKLR